MPLPKAQFPTKIRWKDTISPTPTRKRYDLLPIEEKMQCERCGAYAQPRVDGQPRNHKMPGPGRVPCIR